MRKGSASKGRKPFRVFADDARINIVAELCRIHRIVFVREIRKLARDGEDLQVHFCKVHVAKVRIEAGETFRGELRFAKKLSGLASSVEVQAVEVFDRKIVRMNVDSHDFPSLSEIWKNGSQAGASIHRAVRQSI